MLNFIKRLEYNNQLINAFPSIEFWFYFTRLFVFLIRYKWAHQCV